MLLGDKETMDLLYRDQYILKKKKKAKTKRKKYLYGPANVDNRVFENVPNILQNHLKYHRKLYNGVDSGGSNRSRG